METLDLGAATSELRTLSITPRMTEEEAATSMQFLAPFNQCMLGVVRFSGRTPWECHPDGDELLHVLDGEVQVELLTEAGPVCRTVGPGSAFVVPRGLWHRQTTGADVTLLFATPVDGTLNSWADDPRV
jgi:quercetin dioxygenase-like cupin family protein